jgi:hypothetical protein
MEPLAQRDIERLEQPSAEVLESSTKRPYHPPVLEVLGDIRDLTMGGSPGAGDSGAAYVEFPPGWPG